MPEMPDFNVPFLGKPLSQVKQETWDRLQEEKHQRQLVLVTVSIGKGQGKSNLTYVSSQSLVSHNLSLDCHLVIQTSHLTKAIDVIILALLLDNMLYMVIVPIIPDYLRQIGAWETHEVKVPHEIFKDPVFHKEVVK